MSSPAGIYTRREILELHSMNMYASCYAQHSSPIEMNEPAALASTVRPAPIRRATARPSKQLPEAAIRLMNAWYAAHEDNPYPNRNDLDYLATNGGIKESQVKAWFSNKRNRTQNTHPKRAKRYLVRTQTQQSPFAWQEPQKIHVADQLEERAARMQPACYAHSEASPTPTGQWPWLMPESYECYQAYPTANF